MSGTVALSDIRALGQVTVLVMPVMALSYLVTDTEKYKLSTLLKSPIVPRAIKFKNPEIYDAILPLIFSVFAITGFSIGLFLIVAVPHIWHLDLDLIALGICGFIIIFQIVLSIVVPTLEKHHEKSSTPDVAFVTLALVTLIVLLTAIVSLAELIIASLGLTIVPK